mgnify:CR=1 FL=1
MRLEVDLLERNLARDDPRRVLHLDGAAQLQLHKVLLLERELLADLHQVGRLVVVLRRVRRHLGHRLAVEQAQHHRLAVHDGQGRDPDVDGLAAHHGLDATVLGAAFFRHIQATEDLEATGHRHAHMLGELINVVQNAVDPEPDPLASAGSSSAPFP